MKTYQDRDRRNRRAGAAAQQDEIVLITYQRIPVGKSGVRLQFYLAETGKKWCSVAFKTKVMASIDRAAKRAKMNAGQFIFHMVGIGFRMMEAEAQGQGRAAA